MQLLEEYKSDMKKLKAQLERGIDYRVLNAIFAQCQYILRDFPNERQYCLAYSDFLKKAAVRKYAVEQKASWADTYWNTMLWEARNHVVDSGLLYLEKNRIPKERFYEPRREVFTNHQIIQSLQDLMDDKLDIFGLSVPPGCGKQLADDTPILTTNGWKNHGDLVVGDKVFGID